MRISAYRFLLAMGSALTMAQTPPMLPSQVSPFKHIVVIFQENRTPDNLFQGLCAPPYGTADSCSPMAVDGQYDPRHLLPFGQLDKAAEGLLCVFRWPVPV